MAEKRELDFPPEQSTASHDSDLPSVRSHVPYRVWLVQGLIFLERAASYGASQPFRVSPIAQINA
jgi:POT family proton-dependent oligopeptide transporter